jgi:hypothetical protein
LNGNRTVTLENNGCGNDGISSAGPVKDGWVGAAFGGGGYFEVTFKFDPQTVTNSKTGNWPAWWSMAIEHMASLPSAHWPGQAARYDHYIEPDLFEWDVSDYGDPPGKSYAGAMVDWSAMWPKMVRKIQPWPKFVVTTPSTTDFRQYHKFGWLWVPATATTEGYAQYYFDDQPTTDRVSWTQFTNQTPTPAGQMDPWTFGILDRQHLVLILGSGASGAMTIQSVNVWQKSTRYNGKNGVIPAY